MSDIDIQITVTIVVLVGLIILVGWAIFRESNK